MAAERDELLVQLYERIIFSEGQGLLNNRFINNYIRNWGHNSTFFLVLVETFCEDVQDALSDLRYALEDHMVCGADIYPHYVKLKGIIESFGASAMGLGLEELLCSIQGDSREGCILAHLHLHQGFENLRPHLRAISRIERRLIYLERTLAGDSDDDE